ncbi:MAG: hypothetical protein PHI23_02360 [Candidatus Peribacteraceae bacterium]|nr:hypothetical protein [Candidatus Peribacteraceae bacterium]
MISPPSESKIQQKYSARTLEKKVINKEALQKEIGWPMEPKRPMIALPLGMSLDLGGTLFKELLPGLLSLPVELLVLGRGSSEFGALFTKMAKERGHRVYIVPDTEEAIHKMYAAADMALFLKDPSPLPELAACLDYGVVPVAPECTTLENYNPVQESGNAFLFEEPNAWHCFAALVRALETYRFPFDWRTIQRHGMESTHAE